MGRGVISLSLGGAGKANSAAVDYAWSRGCVVVAAAGNNGTTTRFYPASAPHAISVAATDQNDALTSFSNWGDWVKVAAPGVDIISCSLDHGYDAASGTSVACPHVAGEAALLLAQKPELSNARDRNLSHPCRRPADFPRRDRIWLPTPAALT